MEFFDLHFLLVPVVGGITDPLRHLLLSLGVRGLCLHVVLVELVLGEEVVSQALVQEVKLIILSLQFTFLSTIDLEELLQLELEEGDIELGRWLTISGVGNVQVTLEKVGITGSEVAVRVLVRRRRLEPPTSEVVVVHGLTC